MASDSAKYTLEAIDVTRLGDDLWWVIIANVMASNIADGFLSHQLNLLNYFIYLSCSHTEQSYQVYFKRLSTGL